MTTISFHLPSVLITAGLVSASWAGAFYVKSVYEDARRPYISLSEQDGRITAKFQNGTMTEMTIDPTGPSLKGQKQAISGSNGKPSK